MSTRPNRNSQLYGGVSQQVDALRLPSQCSELVNFLPSVTDNLDRRPSFGVNGVESAIEAITLIDGGGHIGDRFIHHYQRDSDENYTLIFTGNSTDPLQILRVDSDASITSCTVNYVEEAYKPYIQDCKKAVTIGDTTIAVDPSTTPTMDTGNLSTGTSNEALVYFENVVSETKIDITLVSPTETIETFYNIATANRTSGFAAIDYMVNDINNSGTGFNAEKVSLAGTSADTHVFKITHATEDFTIEKRDTYGDQAVVVIKGSVQKFEDLPPYAPDGYKVEVTGDGSDTSASSYFLQYDQSKGVWTETNGIAVSLSYTDGTMPLQIQRTSANTFTVDQITWDERLTGDDETNPLPKFIGSSIRDVTTFSNRLVFVSKEGLDFSRTDDYFNFWSQTGQEVLDDDPIKISILSNEVLDLLSVKALQDNLVVVGRNSQYNVYSNQDTFTPNSVQSQLISIYNVPDLVIDKPIFKMSDRTLGLLTYSDTTDYYTVREYFLTDETFLFDNVEVTEHVPRYLYKIKRVVNVPEMDMIMFVGGDNENEVFVYKYLVNGDSKVQSAFFKWVFPWSVIAMFVIDDTPMALMRDLASSYVLTSMKDRPTEDELDFTNVANFEKSVDMFGIITETLSSTQIIWVDKSKVILKGSSSFTRADLATVNINTLNSYGNPFIYVIDPVNSSRYFHVGTTDDSLSEYRIETFGINDFIVTRLNGDPIFDDGSQPSSLEIRIGFEVNAQYTPSIHYLRDNNGHAIMTGRTQVSTYCLDTERTKRLCVEVNNVNGRGTSSRSFKYSLGDTDVPNLVGYNYFTPVASDLEVSVFNNDSTLINLIGDDHEDLELSYEIVQQPTKGIVTFVGDGSQVTYRHTSFLQGDETDTFTYVASNGSRSSEPATVTVNLSSNTSVSTDFNYSVSFTGEEVEPSDGVFSTMDGGTVNSVDVEYGSQVNDVRVPVDTIDFDSATSSPVWNDGSPFFRVTQVIGGIPNYGIHFTSPPVYQWANINGQRVPSSTNLSSTVGLNSGIVLDQGYLSFNPSIAIGSNNFTICDMYLKVRGSEESTQWTEIVVNGKSYIFYTDPLLSGLRNITTEGTYENPVEGNSIFIGGVTGNQVITFSSKWYVDNDTGALPPVLGEISMFESVAVLNPIDSEPTALSKAYKFDSSSVNNEITLEGFDFDGDAITTYTVEGPPTNGSLSGTAPDLLYTPNDGFRGVDSFTYSVDGGHVGTVTIRVVKPQPQLASNPIGDSHKVYTCTENEDLTINVNNVNPYWIQIEQEGYETKYHDRGR